MFGPANCPVLPIELNSHHCRFLLPDVALKARQQRDEDHDFKLGLWFMGSDDALSQFLDNEILFADKELIFNVDEMLGGTNQI